MKESKLTPFDAETILMIKSVTGHEPEITEKAELFEMRMYVDDKNEYVIEAAINAVIGRYGMREPLNISGNKYFCVGRHSLLSTKEVRKICQTKYVRIRENRTRKPDICIAADC